MPPLRTVHPGWSRFVPADRSPTHRVGRDPSPDTADAEPLAHEQDAERRLPWCSSVLDLSRDILSNRGDGLHGGTARRAPGKPNAGLRDRARDDGGESGGANPGPGRRHWPGPLPGTRMRSRKVRSRLTACAVISAAIVRSPAASGSGALARRPDPAKSSPTGESHRPPHGNRTLKEMTPASLKEMPMRGHRDPTEGRGASHH